MDVKHYGGAENPYEVRKVAEAWGLDRDAYLFNVLKYIARAGKKTPELKPDLVKARDYIDYRIETLDREAPLSPAQAWDDHECGYPDEEPTIGVPVAEWDESKLNKLLGGSVLLCKVQCGQPEPCFGCDEGDTK